MATYIAAANFETMPPKKRSITANCKVKDSIQIYTPPYHDSYNVYYTVWADYISCSIFGIAFLNFESTRLVLLCVATAF